MLTYARSEAVMRLLMEHVLSTAPDGSNELSLFTGDDAC
jgi:hypothetical protein